MGSPPPKKLSDLLIAKSNKLIIFYNIDISKFHNSQRNSINPLDIQIKYHLKSYPNQFHQK